MADIDMYSLKPKKKTVDPNAPPRPNLMTHDVKIRNVQQVVEEQSRLITMLQIRVESLENKLRTQSNYIATLNNKLSLK